MKIPKKDITIIVPVYNEEENLLRVEKELSKYMNQAAYPVEVCFVNDGSGDDSLSLIQEICKKDPRFHFLSFDQNYGLSAAIKAGFDFAQTSLVGYIDSDLQTTPMDFDSLMAFIPEYDLVTGWRNQRKDNWVKNLSSTLANKIRRFFTHDAMNDTGCPLKIIKTNFAKRIPMFQGLHRFLPAMVLLQNGKVKQVPIRHFPRVAGTAKFGLLNRLWGPLMDCFAYLWMKKKYIHYTVQMHSYERQ